MADADTLPPPLALYQIATGHYFSQALYVAASLGIADLLAAGPSDAATLAAKTGSHAASLRRVLRLLASAGVFAEDEDGRFALTPVGDALRADRPYSFRPAALLFTGPLEWQSWGALAHTVRTGETALDHVFGMGTFAYLDRHPDEAAVFDQAMAAFTSMTALAVAAAYDLSSIGTLIDVGGGNGALMIGILNANPTLRGIVFDLPRPIASAAQQVQAAGLADRLATVAGDFFERVPAGGDAYILKHVIHDWDDARAATILAQCRRVMPAHGKLLIVEGVYPRRIEANASSRGAAANDVNMLVVSGGRQRSEAEFRALFSETGFRLTRIVPTASGASVIEGAPA